MPIDYSTYHSDWKKVIRPDILKRSEKFVERLNKNAPCCEFCGVENYALGYRVDGIWNYNEHYVNVKRKGFGFYITSGYTKIVLTVAHLDHNKDNNNYDNLKALCQKCHLDLDKEQHAASRKETIKNKKKQIEMF